MFCFSLWQWLKEEEELLAHAHRNDEVEMGGVNGRRMRRHLLKMGAETDTLQQGSTDYSIMYI